uniref:Uncharacterized protein n=1 Tax=Arundo donax TaxID=35708 RepID=A0A0A9EQ81_ARUDO
MAKERCKAQQCCAKKKVIKLIYFF